MHQFSSCRGFALGETGPHVTDLLDRTEQLADPVFEHRLVCGQGRFQAVRVILKHPPYL